MAIQEHNIRLMASQVMDDVDEGGGRATGTAIADGASNAIFTDISELDRAYGRVNLRKAFVSVDTDDTDGYFGVNVIIADPPGDAHVSCTLFTTRDGFDHRTDAQSRLEAYLVSGPLSTMVPYGNQISGQRAVLVYQRLDDPIAEVGEVHVLSNEAHLDAVVEQFFRVTQVSSALQTFEDENGLYVRRVSTLRISDALANTFTGAEMQRLSVAISTKIRKSTVADASRYYGTLPLTVAAETGDLSLKADTIYTALVPSSTVETPIALGEIQSAARVTVSGAAIVVPAATWGSNVRTLYLRGQIVPTSFSMSTGSANDYWPKMDNGIGDIVTPSGAVVGGIDYTNGIVVPDAAMTAAWASIATSAITYLPGTNVVQSSFTRGIDITLGTRGSVYVTTVVPKPTPGTFVVDYMALGKWYRLRDKGLGVLSGDETAFGSGSINYATGTVIVTLGALPDVGSAVVMSWGSPVDTRVRTATPDVSTEIQLAWQSAVRNSVTVEYTKGGVLKTLTESGDGLLAGDGQTGSVNYLTGEVVIDGFRDQGTDIHVEYSYGDDPDSPPLVTENFTNLTRESDLSINFVLSSPSPLVPHTVLMSWTVNLAPGTSGGPNALPLAGLSKIVDVKDDGLGSLKFKNGDIAGAINYTTGTVNFFPDTALNVPVPQYKTRSFAVDPLEYDHVESVSLPFLAPFDIGIVVKYQNTDSAVTVATVTETFTPPFNFTLLPNTLEAVLPNGVLFTIGGAAYADRDGIIYKDSSITTGSGTEAGSIDYSTGKISLTSWPITSVIAIQSCLSVVGGRSAVNAVFRTAGAPIRPASLYVQATAIDGTLITGTANQTGAISGELMRGTVNVITGFASVEFGEMVTAAGNEDAFWYDAGNVVSGEIFKPIDVFPGTIKDNAVVVSSLPLDASIIGLDPVRLPADGRVPIFRDGDMSVIHHTATKAPQTVTNGQTVDLARTRLSRVRVIGNDGVTITDGYSTDLDAGTVTFTDVSGYSQPIHIEHRIEDMALISDAQINGSLAITRQLTHDFPLGSYVSSALIIGDMRARVPYLFDQATWDSTWSDTISGSAATATFNDVLAPVEVTNQGAITERWAVRFTNTTAFQVIGEHVGVIATGNTATDCAPNNPATGVPYFTIPATGWGAGWAAGNVLRLKTIGSLFPVWISRTIQQGAATAEEDSFTVLVRGDIDRP